MKDIFDKIVIEPLSSFTERLVEFLPNLLSSIIILVLGFVVGWVLKTILIKMLNILNADKFCQRVGLTDSLKKGGIKDTPSLLFAKVFSWLVAFSFLIMALYALKMPAVENLLEQFFLYLPNVFVAFIIVISGYLLGNFFSRATLIASVNAGIRFSSLLAKGVKMGIFILSVTMALEQLGIGRDTVIVAFTIIFGGLVFALSLAFGLAGKDIAREYLEKRLKGERKEEDDLKHL